MLYNWIKILHIISSALLLGIGVAIVFYTVHMKENTDLAQTRDQFKWILKITAYVLLPAGLFQPLSGFSLIFLKSQDFNWQWVAGALVGYLLIGLLWLPGLFLQLKNSQMLDNAIQQQTPLPPLYDRYYRYWLRLLLPTSILLIVVFFLMANKPIL